jgi:transposase
MGRSRGGLTTKIHALVDGRGLPIQLHLSEGQMSDNKGAALMINAFPGAKALLADRGYDADWFRHALAERGITPCIPSKTNRKVPIPARHRPLPSAPQGRKHVRQAQGLAPHPHPLRQMRPYVHVRNLHRSNRHHLAATMSPEPSKGAGRG